MGGFPLNSCFALSTRQALSSWAFCDHVSALWLIPKVNASCLTHSGVWECFPWVSKSAWRHRQAWHPCVLEPVSQILLPCASLSCERSVRAHEIELAQHADFPLCGAPRLLNCQASLQLAFFSCFLFLRFSGDFLLLCQLCHT